MHEMKKKVFNEICGALKDIQDYYDGKINLKAYEIKTIPEFNSIEEESDFWDEHSTEEYGHWKPITKKQFLDEMKQK